MRNLRFIKKYKTAIGIVLGLTLAGAILGATLAIVTKPIGATGQGCHWECARSWHNVCVDWDYVCPTPSATPTASPTVSPTPSPSSEPTASPTVEPTPVDLTDHSIKPKEAERCVDEGKPEFTPTVTYAWRTGTNLLVKWTPTDPVKEFVVYYGPTGKELVWNTGRVQGHEVTIHKVTSMADVVVCAVSRCGVENCSVRFIDP